MASKKKIQILSTGVKEEAQLLYDDEVCQFEVLVICSENSVQLLPDEFRKTVSNLQSKIDLEALMLKVLETLENEGWECSIHGWLNIKGKLLKSS